MEVKKLKKYLFGNQAKISSKKIFTKKRSKSIKKKQKIITN